MTPKKLMGEHDTFATRDDVVAKMERLKREHEKAQEKHDRWDWI